MFRNPVITVIVVVLDNDTVSTLTEANIGSHVEKVISTVQDKNKDKKRIGLSTVLWSLASLATWGAIAGFSAWPYLKGGAE
jgi:hypothetical protein